MHNTIIYKYMSKKQSNFKIFLRKKNMKIKIKNCRIFLSLWVKTTNKLTLA